MKSQLKKAAAAALALTMCLPTAALAETIETSFGVYSPTLKFSVPLKADIKINPIADNAATGVGKFSVASNSIDIMNASVDVANDKAIPVTVTVQAAISSKKADVVTLYNTFTADAASTKKKIYLELSAAQTDASITLKTGATAAFDTDKLLDLDKYEIVPTAQAVYTTPAKKSSITKYGALLSLDIAGPTTSDTAAANATFSSDATKVEPAVGSFAVTGVANTNADWKADDIKVNLVYNIKASQPLNITNPAITTPPAMTGAAETEITVPDVGEATVLGVAIHNDDEGKYGDVVLEACTVKYVVNSGATDAKITIPKDDVNTTYLANAENGYKGAAQDLVVLLSDGRAVVSTLTVN